MSVDLDQIGAELEKLKAELGVRVLTITYHPTFFSVYFHYYTKDEPVAIGHGDSLKEALEKAQADRAEWLKENISDYI